ncbi:lute isoform d [Anaeramoeba flamelloides]|uniref:Lute isoform d n=1 Tax=Anaeramoeba flamelloides TaxID=1746091 RepID=A0AAV7YFN8_9EUKA|nr:lute isoform d [Anaeramoeba flamelloides]
MNNQELANVEFLVGKKPKKLCAHKLILSCRSKFLKQILYPSGWEHSKFQIVQITLSDISFKAFQVVLNYLYKNEVVLNIEIFYDVFLCAQKFQLQELCSICLRWLQVQINDRNFMSVFKSSYQMKNQDLINILLGFFENNFSNLIRTKNFFNQLDLDMLSILVEKINKLNNISEMKNIIVSRFIEFVSNYFYQRRRKQINTKKIFTKIEDLFKGATMKISEKNQIKLTKEEIEQLLNQNIIEGECSGSLVSNTKQEKAPLQELILKKNLNQTCDLFQNHKETNNLNLISKTNQRKRKTLPTTPKVLKKKKTLTTKRKKLNLKRKKLILKSKMIRRVKQLEKNTQKKLISKTVNDSICIAPTCPCQDKVQFKKSFVQNYTLLCQNYKKVLLVSTDQTESHLSDVKKSICINDNISHVHELKVNNFTPTYDNLKTYDSIFLFSSINAFHNSKMLGDTLAKYVDNGGGLVMSTYRCLYKKPLKYRGSELKGKIVTKQYLPINKGALKEKRSSLGEVLINNHPLMKDIKKFDGGGLSYRIQFKESSFKNIPNINSNNIDNQKNNNTVVVAKWSDGIPLLFYNHSPNGKGKIVYLNFWPISGEVYGYKGKYNYWQSKHDGRKLIVES